MPKIVRHLGKHGEEILKDIQKNYGNTLSLEGVASYLGVSRRTALRWVKGENDGETVDGYEINGRVRYSATSMARKLESSRVN